MSEPTTWSLTRFRQCDLPALASALRIPDFFDIKREQIQGMECLVTLVRLHDPSTWEDVRVMMGDRHCSRTYGHMFYRVIEHIYFHFKRCIDDITRWTLWVPDAFAPGRAPARAVPRLMADPTRVLRAPDARQLPGLAKMVENILPLENLISFVDGMAKHMCRPTSDQDLAYNPYYGYHGLKFQGLMSLLGLWLEWWGPQCIRASDSGMLLRSGLLDRLQAIHHATGVAYQIYGDPAYPKTPYSQSGYKGSMTQAQLDFCGLMNPVRQVVENGFGNLMRLWGFLNFHPALKLQKTPVGKLYWVAAILTNLHVIQYGDAISSKYKTTETGLTFERYMHEFPPQPPQ